LAIHQGITAEPTPAGLKSNTTQSTNTPLLSLEPYPQWKTLPKRPSQCRTVRRHYCSPRKPQPACSISVSVWH